jgi:4-hydroxybenzoate polyprenyltransferase
MRLAAMPTCLNDFPINHVQSPQSMTTTGNQNSSTSMVLPWLRLLRISALPSAISNILMAYLLVNQSWSPGVELIFLVLASSSLYLSGMVLNDVFDVEVDRAERPNRPIPAGQISKSLASKVGFGLLTLGVVLAVAAGWLGNHGATLGIKSPLFRTGAIAILLAICIILYDGPLKKTIVAPILMGGCRFLNVMLGASTFIPLATGIESAANQGWLGLPMVIWGAASAIGLMVAGVTLLGRREAAAEQSRIGLTLGGLGIIAGLVGIALTAYSKADFDVSEKTKQLFPLFVGLASMTIVRRVVEAVFVATPPKIQAAVISVLRSLIIFDAMLCYLVSPNSFMYALLVLALLIPSILLSKVISST